MFASDGFQNVLYIAGGTSCKTALPALYSLSYANTKVGGEWNVV